MKTPRLRLSHDVLFWSVAIPVFLIRTMGRWERLERLRPLAPVERKLRYLALTAPGNLFRAALIALIVAAVADLFVRLVVRPLVARWLSPTPRGAGAVPREFVLGDGERVLAEVPGRLAIARSWRPGALALTDRRLWFFPHAWDVEPWSLPLADLASIWSVPAPRHTRGLVNGHPDRLAFRARSGAEATVAVAEPDEVVDWFRRGLAEG